MIQFIKKIWKWFMKLLSDENNEPNDENQNNNINIISFKIRYIKEK